MLRLEGVQRMCLAWCFPLSLRSQVSSCIDSVLLQVASLLLSGAAVTVERATRMQVRVCSGYKVVSAASCAAIWFRTVNLQSSSLSAFLLYLPVSLACKKGAQRDTLLVFMLFLQATQTKMTRSPTMTRWWTLQSTTPRPSPCRIC